MVRLIDADELMKTLMHEGLGYQYNRVMCAPTVDAVPVRHGKWIEYPIADGMNQCSECGVLRLGCSNYCPNCGAKMEREEE